MTTDLPRGPTATELHQRVVAHAALVTLWNRKHRGQPPANPSNKTSHGAGA